MKLTANETTLVNTPFICLCEDDKILRKNILEKIQNEREKKNFYLKKKQKLSSKIEITDKIICSKNRSSKEKQSACRTLGLFLIKNGKEKLGLEYFNESIKYYQLYRGMNHFGVLNDMSLYATLEKRTQTVLKNRKLNNENIKLKQQEKSIRNKKKQLKESD